MSAYPLLAGVPAIVVLVAAAAPAGASDTPVPGPRDPRIQTVAYDAYDVVLLKGRPGFQLTVEFAPGERIENVAVGDGGSWQATPNRQGDRLFLKPNENAGVSNMVVVTDARTYTFELDPSGDDQAPFLVRFTYPPAAGAARAAAADPSISRYALGGTRALRPTRLWDDGIHTYMTFAPDQPMPAVFALDRNGEELLVNGAIRDGSYVIDSVAPRLRFRVAGKLATATRLPRARPADER